VEIEDVRSFIYNFTPSTSVARNTVQIASNILYSLRDIIVCSPFELEVCSSLRRGGEITAIRDYTVFCYLPHTLAQSVRPPRYSIYGPRSDERQSLLYMAGPRKWFTCPQTVTVPSRNLVWRKAASLAKLAHYI